MWKTKPSERRLFAALLLGTIVAGGCVDEPSPALRRAAADMRPIDDILALRMSRVSREVVPETKPDRPVPDSHVRWRVESIMWQELGEDARQVDVSVEGQRALIHGIVPTHWQADDIRDRLADVDVLRAAELTWHVERPNERRPPPPVDPLESIPESGAESPASDFP